MANYRRIYENGGTYFFTIVTYKRARFLTTALAQKCLKEALRQTKRKYPFVLDAMCVLPDHLHCIWTLPANDHDYSRRWAFFKGFFTRLFITGGGQQGFLTAVRARKGEAAVWQRRFFEHNVGNDNDFYGHLNYVHYNPVKHVLVARPADWKWSTFHKYVKTGMYDADWGETLPDNISVEKNEWE
jgi:putative transposase